MASDGVPVESTEVGSSESDIKAKLQEQDDKLTNLTTQISKLTATAESQQQSNSNSSYTADSQFQLHSVRLDSLSSQMNDMMNTVQNLQDAFIPIANASNQKKENEKSELLEVRLCSMNDMISTLMVDMKSMQSTMENIQLRMNGEEKKESDSSDRDLRKEIDEIKMTLNKLTGKQALNKVDSEKEAFRKWMENTLKLPEYTSLFIENGIENLNVVRMLTVTELNQIGISKIGHRMQILRGISILNGNGSVAQAANASHVPSEGTGTPYM